MEYNGVAIGVKFDAEPTETDEAAAGVIIEALQKLHERNDQYRDLWQDGGTGDSAHHILHKAKRVHSQNANARTDSAEDDAIDLINYCIFFILNRRAGRISQ